jgi:hypothetical protein
MEASNMIVAKPTPLVMTEATDPEEIAKIKARESRWRKNTDWLEANIPGRSNPLVRPTRQEAATVRPKSIRKHRTAGP